MVKSLLVTLAWQKWRSGVLRKNITDPLVPAIWPVSLHLLAAKFGCIFWLNGHKISVGVNPALHLFQYDELCSKGNFTREDIVTVLTAHQVS